MELIFEMLFEFLIEGCFGAATSKKIPLVFRIIVATILIAVYGGLVGFCFFQGIKAKSIAFLFVGIALLLFIAFGIRKTYHKKYK